MKVFFILTAAMICLQGCAINIAGDGGANIQGTQANPLNMLIASISACGFIAIIGVIVVCLFKISRPQSVRDIYLSANDKAVLERIHSSDIDPGQYLQYYTGGKE